MNDFRPINRRTLPQIIAQQILDLIKHGSYSKGSRLPAERDLMKKLCVSRPCLREALQGLAMLGVIRIEPGRGTFIATDSITRLDPLGMAERLSKGILQNLFEVRQILETEAAAMAAVRGTDEELRALALLQEKLSDAHGEKAREISVAIHMQIASATHNETMIEIIGQITKKLWVHQADLYADGNPNEDVKSHRDLVSGILSRDPQKAKKAMQLHLSNTARLMMLTYSSSEEVI